MRPWAKWCIEHRMSWAVSFAMLLCVPVYLVVGCYTGCAEIFNEWWRDWRRLQREARAAQEGKSHDQ